MKLLPRSNATPPARRRRQVWWRSGLGSFPMLVVLGAVIAFMNCGRADVGPGDPRAQLDVVVATTGEDVDGDGYSVRLDGEQTLPVAINGTARFVGITPGSHSIELLGLAANCAVSGPNPRTITLPADRTTSVTLQIGCAALTGDLGVSVATAGADQDPDGYVVTVGPVPTPSGVASGTASASHASAPPQSQPVGVNGTVTFRDVPVGDYAVELSELAANCAVTQANPATVTVPPAGTASLSWSVTCTALRGDLETNVSTTGSDLDPDGYTVTVDGGQAQSIGINGSYAYNGLTEGDHTVELSGIAANCTVSGGNPRTVTVVFGGTATTTFAVSCTARVGDLEVAASTTGSDPDPDGYTVVVDGAQSQAIGVNGTVTFAGLAEGSHSLHLTDVAGNCTVSGTNPRTVTVPFAGTATTTFAITCTARTGNLAVSVSTTGSDVDPDGYTVTVDGTQSQAVGANGTVTFVGVAEGDRPVELSDVASNCTVSPPNPRTVTVSFGSTAAITFTVTCTSRLGDLAVAVTTTGSDLDPDGYIVTVDAGPSRAVASNGTVTFTGLAEGEHSVELTGMAGNCTVSGANPRAVNVPYGGTASIAFSVACAFRLGDLEVTASTTGSDPDPDGYTVTVDGGSSLSIASNGTVTFTGLAEGDHTVELSGIADNCTVGGANPRTVTVLFAGTAATAFAVTCSSRTGDLAVTTSTSGADPDPNGYAVLVDGAQSQTIGVNATVTFAGLPEGDHSVELTGIASNCTVSGGNPRTVTVVFGGTATTTFAVTCTPRTGNLTVSVSTTGSDLDPDGYTVTVDGTQSQAVGANGSVTFVGVAEGDRTVELGDVAGNCTVSPPNPRTVTVPFGGTAATSFTVTCTSRLGDLAVTTSTAGSDLDPDGYTVTVDGGQSQAVGINQTFSFTGLAEGNHTVQLTGVADNCSVSGANPRTVTVPFAGTATTTFAVTCAPRVGDLDVTATTTGSDLDPDGYTVTVDGSQTQGVSVNATVTFSGLHEGAHTVALSGIASNCSVTANPRTVAVPFNGTSTTTFAVTCVPRVGDLTVTTGTSGSDLDPDGYTVTVDGGQGQSIDIDGSVTFTDLAEGDHSVELTGVVDNCTVSGDNPRTVTVPYASAANTDFEITCVARIGDLTVATSTTGNDLDPDGYTVTVDGGQSQNIGINGSHTYTGLTEGDHSVEISGLAPNCSVSDANPRTVAVPFAGTGSTTFDVTCLELGDIEVSVSTVGSPVDPDGYTVTVDGSLSQPIGVDGTVIFADLADGQHTVELDLSSVASICSVLSQNPQTVTVQVTQTTPVTFEISCGQEIFVGAGDISSCGNDRDEFTAQILDTMLVAFPGVAFFTAGDNAYPAGRTQDYQDCYDPTWGRHNARTYPALGNREYDADNTAQASFDYFGDRIPLPEPTASSPTGYYSFELGQWHIVVLNDNDVHTPFQAGDPQDLWFQADLAANASTMCTMVIWHQPLFHSSTSTGGATVRTSRRILWQRAYEGGADVIVNGHNHFYERFHPMDHNGNVDSTAVRGFIVGTGGDSSAPPVEIAANSVTRSGGFGVIKFTLTATSYDWVFVPALPTGTTFTDSGSGSCH